jgi:predicted metal-dependent hydrolase
MTSRQSRSPAALAFGPRRAEFDLATALAGDWHGGSAFRTAYFNAMSMLFPLGEKFFIDTVRYYQHEVEDPKLLEEIAAFRAQEATHRRQHQKYNDMLCKERGYDLERFERPLRDRMAWAYRTFSARRRLAGTVANEHLTAIMANDMLLHDDAFSGADPNVAALWLWHGIEETEHKAVAFDVFIAAGGTVRERRQALMMNTFFFFKDTFRNLCIMLKHDGKLWSLSEWLDGFEFLFIRPGILRRVFFAYLGFYRKNFHPWQHDNRELIANWEKSYGKNIPRLSS